MVCYFRKIKNKEDFLYEYNMFKRCIQVIFNKILNFLKEILKLVAYHRNKIYKLSYVIISAILVILPILGSLGFTPFFRNANKGINEIRKIKYDIQLEDKGVKAGYINKGDKGFNELLSVIVDKKSLGLIAKDIKQIGLAYGELPLKTAMVGPNFAVYIVYLRNGKRYWEPIIFHPFDPNMTFELRDIIGWVKEENLSRINLYMLILIPIWTVFSVLTVFKI